jgi:hypothetical protein
MPSERTRFRFFIFTCREPAGDFRLPIVEALRDNYETWYIWLRRHPQVSGPGHRDKPVEMSLPRMLAFIRASGRDDAVNVYFNSTNTYFPGMTVLLRLIAPRGVWCLDMHDDLRYHNQGWRRRREEVIVAVLRLCSHVVLHAAPSLTELFPRSRHLGNASHLLPLCHGGAADDAVLIIASFDERFDFAFLEELAELCPSQSFHLYGWTRSGDPATVQDLRALPGRHANILYHGPYTMADLPGILGRYRVSVAPYRAGSALTRYIDPLRYYHCLNAGLEVVSTDIPQARYMRDYIHVVDSPAACAGALAGIRAGRLAKQPAYSPITWHQRADRLVRILRSLPRTAALADGPIGFEQPEPQ